MQVMLNGSRIVPLSGDMVHLRLSSLLVDCKDESSVVAVVTVRAVGGVVTMTAVVAAVMVVAVVGVVTGTAVVAMDIVTAVLAVVMVVAVVGVVTATAAVGVVIVTLLETGGVLAGPAVVTFVTVFTVEGAKVTLDKAVFITYSL